MRAGGGEVTVVVGVGCLQCMHASATPLSRCGISQRSVSACLRGWVRDSMAHLRQQPVSIGKWFGYRD
jgi:hypothetical protein